MSFPETDNIHFEPLNEHDVQDGNTDLSRAPILEETPSDEVNFPISSPINSIESTLDSFSSGKLFLQRSLWLIGLLLLQSFSSWILSSFDEILKRHFLITIFLTMMLGTGGNAGAQTCVLFIRGLATKEIHSGNKMIIFLKEQRNGFVLGLILGLVGFLRVFVFHFFQKPNANFWMESLVISIALWAIVTSSVLFGSLLPIAFDRIGIDPAHSGPTIQVVMDMFGVVVICTTATLLLK
jgi:Mg/Co/Ni transporter MgtE